MYVDEYAEEQRKDCLTLTKQSWKCKRNKEAPIRRSFCTAASTAVLMVLKALGQE